MIPESANFIRYRSIIGFHRSRFILAWAKLEYPNLDLHHILGSTQQDKYTDYLVIPISHFIHITKVEHHKAYYFDIYLLPSTKITERYCNMILNSNLDFSNIEPEHLEANFIKMQKLEQEQKAYLNKIIPKW